ncbi:hypothetical protein [Nocardiopsis alba]|uniref:hypothetical protein n=1 Tax=Nocardiopsis alba TaxID=53437 RepID=UPI0003764916|nr:hypothetical protein [Nocardiopsis alba]
MKALSTVAALVLGGVLLGASPAHAATGEVVVFKTELEDLERYTDPASGGCHRLPATAHVLFNMTDTEVRIHPGTTCFAPGVPVAPDRGWHAPPSGLFSFSVA